MYILYFILNTIVFPRLCAIDWSLILYIVTRKQYFLSERCVMPDRQRKKVINIRTEIGLIFQERRLIFRRLEFFFELTHIYSIDL